MYCIVKKIVCETAGILIYKEQSLETLLISSEEKTIVNQFEALSSGISLSKKRPRRARGNIIIPSIRRRALNTNPGKSISPQTLYNIYNSPMHRSLTCYRNSYIRSTRVLVEALRRLWRRQRGFIPLLEWKIIV